MNKRPTTLLPRRWTRLALTALVVALIVAPLTAVAGHGFNDVPSSHTFHEDIGWLADAGVTKGCNPPANDEFCPEDNVTRGQMGAFMRRFAQYIGAEDGTPAQAGNAARVGGKTLDQIITEVEGQLSPEPNHVVGTSGEPNFGDGGPGDCLWRNPPPSTGILNASNPTSFYKDAFGIVHLAGVPAAFDGPGGDGVCDTASDLSDVRIFQLPAGYHPQHLEVFPSGNTTIGINLIVPQGGITVDGEFIPGGTVLASIISDGNATTLDGFSFRAASAGSAQNALEFDSLQELLDLLGS
jgi:hypothetical protein